MKLHLPKALLVAVVAAVCGITQTNAATYYLNAANGNDAAISASFAEASGNTAYTTNDGVWKKFCSGQVGSYDGPHQLVIDQKRNEGEKVKIDFAPFCVSGLNVMAEATNNHLVRYSSADGIVIGSIVDNVGVQSSSFAENFTLEHEGQGVIQLIGEQEWTIADNKKLTLTGSVTNNGTTTITGGEASISGVFTNKGSMSVTNSDLTISKTILGNGKLSISEGGALIITDVNALRKQNVDTWADGLSENGSGMMDVVRVITDGNLIGDVKYTVNNEERVSKNSSSISLGETYNAYRIVKNTDLSNELVSEITNSGNTYVAIKGGVTLDNSQGNAFESEITLTGDGTYILTLGSSNQAATDRKNMVFTDPLWTGTVKFIGGGLNLKLEDYGNSFANANSRLEMNGVTMYLHTSTVDENIVLTNTDAGGTALMISNGSSSGNNRGKFIGSISGTGDMAFVWTSGSNTYVSGHEFLGDTSEWDGWFKADKNTRKITEVTFSSGGQVFSINGNGGVIDEHSKGDSLTNVIIDANINAKSIGEEKTIFNGSIQNVKSLDVRSSTTFKQTVDASRLIVNNVADFEKGFSVTELVMSSGSKVSSTTTISEVSNIQVLGAATLEAGLDLSGTITLQLDGTLNLGDNALTLACLTLNGSKLSEILALTEGNRVDLFSGVGALTLNGQTYTMGSNILDATSNIDLGTYFTLADAATPTTYSDSVIASGYYLGYDATGTVYAGKLIPEPTTATLSLLALAALAARRRRR